MESDKLDEREIEAIDHRKLTTNHYSSVDRRSTVAGHYKANVEARKSNPDRILYDGEDLTYLDEGESLKSGQGGY